MTGPNVFDVTTAGTVREPGERAGLSQNAGNEGVAIVSIGARRGGDARL
jgi:hypothetical protein